MHTMVLLRGTAHVQTRCIDVHTEIDQKDMIAQAGLFADEPMLVATKTNQNANKLALEDRAIHDWYRFVLSFPPHLVQEYLARFGLQRGQTVLDPFCGTGTTVVEAKRQGIAAVGIEANAMAHFASQVKTDWRIDPDQLEQDAAAIAEGSSDDPGGHRMAPLCAHCRAKRLPCCSRIRSARCRCTRPSCYGM